MQFLWYTGKIADLYIYFYQRKFRIGCLHYFNDLLLTEICQFFIDKILGDYTTDC